MSLKKTLDDWANDLAKKAQKATTLQESTDAFKAVSAYHAAQQKNAKKNFDEDEDEPGGFSFASGEVKNGESGQRAGIRARRAS